MLLIAVLAFIFGALVAGGLAWRAGFHPIAPPAAPEPTSAPLATASAGSPTEQASNTPNGEQALNTMTSLETRVAMLEDRLSRLDLQANAASGNASRAESLLIAFAARRLTDKGEQLGYVADQLKLRFGNAQPAAVDTIVSFAKKPVTLDELSSRLEALIPALVGVPSRQSTWRRFSQGLASLFVLYRDAGASERPEEVAQRAELSLRSGRIEPAIDAIQQLPGSAAAQAWTADARRYAAVQGALDLIETTAMLEPRRLQDSQGRKVAQPSPLSPPTAVPSAAP
jgi:hypothetical protein